VSASEDIQALLAATVGVTHDLLDMARFIPEAPAEVEASLARPWSGNRQPGLPPP
jgi:hypothetical protein